MPWQTRISDDNCAVLGQKPRAQLLRLLVPLPLVLRCWEWGREGFLGRPET